MKKAYLTAGLEVIGKVHSKSEAFKLAWSVARVMHRKYVKMYSRFGYNMTVRDYFSLALKETMKRYHQTVSETYVAKKVKKEFERLNSLSVEQLIESIRRENEVIAVTAFYVSSSKVHGNWTND